MPDFDPSVPPTYNSMQQQLGLPPVWMQTPPVLFPGQVSAAMAMGGPGAVMSLGSPGMSFGAGMFPTQQLQTFTNQGPMLQGPTGVMMPMGGAGPNNPYSAGNPYAGLGSLSPGLFSPPPMGPPPAYAGQPGRMPFAAPPPAPWFNTPYTAGLEREHLAGEQAYSRGWAAGGLGARVGADAMGGFAGAAIGARFGGAAGAMIGGALGLFGSERMGFGAGAQNAFGNYFAAPALQTRAMAGGIEELSQGFVSGGAFMNARGSGFTHHASMQAAQGIRGLAEDSSFQRQTFNRFNQQDLFKITESASQEGLMSGVSSPGQMTSRVKEVAKSLTAFMELAQEPDIQRAIQTMGSLRASGLNLQETTQAVTQGRSFARLAGTSFSELSQIGGAMGSQTAQAMGLTQGLGFQTGMMNYGLARAGQNAGLQSAQMMNFVGGASGLANMNNMFSNTMLQMPMVAPGMMSANGGLDTGALQGLISGQSNLFSMTARGSGALQAMTGRQGVEGLGMAVAMQPLLQDTIGRTLQAQGPFAQRNVEDQQVMALARQLGMRGSAGYLTAAQAMGMDRTQALTHAQEMGSPGYFERQSQQIEVRRREAREETRRAREAEAPGMLETFGRLSGLSESMSELRRGAQDLFHGAEHAIGVEHRSEYRPGTDTERRADARMARSSEMRAYMRDLSTDGAERGQRRRGSMSRLRDGWDLAQLQGTSGVAAAINAPFYEGSSLYAQWRRSLGDPQWSDRDVQQQLDDYREGSRLSGQLISTTNAERDRAERNIGSTFGRGPEGERIRSQFALRVANGMTGNASAGEGVSVLINAGFRTGVGFLTRGYVDPGNILGNRAMSGTNYRQAFVEAAVANGMSAEEATRRFNENPSRIMQQASGAAMAAMTPEQRQAAYANAERGAGVGSLGGTGEARRARERNVGQSLFGEHARTEDTDAFLHTRENVQGQTTGNARTREASRDYVTTASMITASMRNATGENRRALESQWISLREEAARRGIDVGRLDSQVNVGADAMKDGSLDMSRRFAAAHQGQSGAQLLDAASQGVQDSRRVRIAGRIHGGAAALAASGGAVGDALRGVTADNYNHEHVMDQFRGMGADALRELGRQDSGLAAAVRRLQRPGSRGGEEAVMAALERRGERDSSLREEYRRTHGTFSRIVDRITGGGEDRYVRENMNRTSAEDARADQQQGQVGAMAAAARNLGIGGGNDALQTAARDLARAAENLNNMAGNRSVDDVLGGGN